MNAHQPDFEQFLKLIRGEKPDRPVLFEHYIDWAHIHPVLGSARVDNDNPRWGWVLNALRGVGMLGYDCLPIGCRWMGFLHFAVPQRDHQHSVGQFGDGVIHDEASLRAYDWPDPEQADVNPYLDGIASAMPAGMKMLLGAPLGIYDTLVELVGFERLCYMVADETDLLEAICQQIGRRSVRIIQRCVSHPAVGGVEVCDDWGFKTGTFLSPDDMQRFILPWHKRIVQVTHAAGKVAILHSCGNVQAVMDDVIDDLGYDAKHSFEDAICPVEQMHQQYGQRITILGGMDVDFLVRSTPEAIYRRARQMLERSGGRRYALGSGNSITPEMSVENYRALLRAAWEGWPR